MTAGEHLEHVEVPSEEALRAWLSEHHDQQAGVWIVTWKKHVPDRHVTHEQVLDQLVAFGWTDGIARRVDADRTRQLVSPRRTKPWAKSYKDRAERLITEGRMHPSGLAAVEYAKATGMWDAMNDVDALQVPDDLAEALDTHPPGRRALPRLPAVRAPQHPPLDRLRPDVRDPHPAHHPNRHRRPPERSGHEPRVRGLTSFP